MKIANAGCGKGDVCRITGKRGNSRERDDFAGICSCEVPSSSVTPSYLECLSGHVDVANGKSHPAVVVVVESISDKSAIKRVKGNGFEDSDVIAVVSAITVLFFSVLK